MKTVRKIIKIDEEKCDGCGQCILSCAEGALAIVDGKAKVISDNLCDGLGACLGQCPQDALRIIERQAEDFDEQAVEEHLRARKDDTPKEKEAKVMACGCPSSHMQVFSSCEQANKPKQQDSHTQSALTHWPVKIRLIAPPAPFLKNADLLVTADCVPVAFANLHQELLPGKIVMLGCPKFDDAHEYVDRFAAIFETVTIKSITTAIMEVPCCSGLPKIVKKAMAKARIDIPIHEVVISTRGQRIDSAAQSE
ncbi:MAG: 4Fe-4S ferredoxin [Desulfobacteraceae bacterium]|nr:4Fe-4S ferredoxin [Desulfobacteraceae bacterium]